MQDAELLCLCLLDWEMFWEPSQDRGIGESTQGTGAQNESKTKDTISHKETLCLLFLSFCYIITYIINPTLIIIINNNYYLLINYLIIKLINN